MSAIMKFANDSLFFCKPKQQYNNNKQKKKKKKFWAFILKKKKIIKLKSFKPKFITNMEIN